MGYDKRAPRPGSRQQRALGPAMRQRRALGPGSRMAGGGATVSRVTAKRERARG
jgi:hypothetical protein